MARDTSTSPRQPRHRKFRRSPRAGAGSKAVCQFIIGVFSCEEKREKAKRSLWGSPNINLRGVGLGERGPDYLSYELLPFWGTDYPQPRNLLGNISAKQWIQFLMNLLLKSDFAKLSLQTIQKQNL